MPQSFIECGREQSFLLPPSLLEWLPEGHLAWTILDAVAELDLSAFYAAYRADGRGRPAYEPSMMVALLLYAYARGNRSSRGIERGCVEDVGYRVICANLVPDHSTIAEFRRRHESALADLFGGVLRLCQKAGLVRVGVIAIDGTKLDGNASHHNNLDYERLTRAILAEADRIDREEDERFGRARGDELPVELSTAAGRRAALKKARRELEREAQAGLRSDREDELELPEVALELRVEEIVDGSSGRRAWPREAARQIDAQREQRARPVRRDRAARLLEAERRLREDLAAEWAANDAYNAYRAGGRDKRGRGFGSPPKPYQPPDEPGGVVNTSDPDSHNMQTAKGWVQGYNAQAAVTENQIVIAAEIMVRSPTSETWNRWSQRPRPSSGTPASANRSGSAWPTPGIGISARWRASSAAGSNCWSRPTPTSARARQNATGRAAPTRSCAGYSPAITAPSSTENARA